MGLRKCVIYTLAAYLLLHPDDTILGISLLFPESVVLGRLTSVPLAFFFRPARCLSISCHPLKRKPLCLKYTLSRLVFDDQPRGGKGWNHAIYRLFPKMLVVVVNTLSRPKVSLIESLNYRAVSEKAAAASRAYPVSIHADRTRPFEIDARLL